MVFQAIVMNIGLNWKPTISDYWSRDPTILQQWFGEMMPRDRFQAIYHCALHAGPATAEGPDKIDKMFEIIRKTFSAFYYPGQNVAVDETAVAFKGRFHALQYNPSKPRAKWHLKLFTLADSSTGYVYDLSLIHI